MEMNRLQILVVDDEEILRNSLVKYLEKKGFHVEKAASGNEAIGLLERMKFDCILSDIRMPNGDGISFLSRVNLMEGEKPLFMFMTGYGDPPAEELIGMGAQHVFDKPINRQDILAKIEELMKRP